jgi:hypothetical protein
MVGGSEAMRALWPPLGAFRSSLAGFFASPGRVGPRSITNPAVPLRAFWKSSRVHHHYCEQLGKQANCQVPTACG